MHPRSLATLALVAMLLAACSAPAAPVTNAPQATPGGGGGGNGAGSGGGGTGSVQFEISGAVQKTGELPFFAAFSRFADEPAGVSLLYMTENGTENVSVFEFQGTYLVGFTSDEFSISTPSCEFSDTQINGSSASGSFDFQGAQVITGEGELAPEPARITGSFSASR